MGGLFKSTDGGNSWKASNSGLKAYGINQVAIDPIDHAMVKSINDIGHVMGMKTIAEFVENDAIRSMLKELSVDYAQGYEVGMPLPFADILGIQRHPESAVRTGDDQPPKPVYVN